MVVPLTPQEIGEMGKRLIRSTQERRWDRLKRELARGFGRGTDLLLDGARRAPGEGT